MDMRRVEWVVVVVGLAMFSMGCRQRHLSKDYGTSYARAFAVQLDPGKKQPSTAAVGLDAQEAAITANTYREGLAPEGETVKQQPTVIVAPATRERPAPLAPSIPKE
jgi:hypothetical protein